MYSGKPIIGIAGGIGSGKSYVSRIFGQLGCLVVDSDAQVRDAYAQERVRAAVREWWGPGVFTPTGEVDKSAIAGKIFGNPQERSRLERLLHPLVNEARVRLMEASAADPRVVAFVWDTPLLFETGLNRECDVVVFVDASEEERTRRVRETRRWDADELARRENLQMPLDKKRGMSDYVLKNAADAEDLRRQVSDVLSQILARVAGLTRGQHAGRSSPNESVRTRP